MPYLSDRMRVELTLLPQMMLTVYLDGCTDEERSQNPDWAGIKQDLITAGTESIQDLRPARKQNQVLGRATRLNDMFRREVVQEGTTVAKVGLITFHLMRFIVEDGYLQYPEGSAMDRSVQAFMESLEPHAKIEAVNQSAIKQARKMLKLLQAEGYYQGVEPSG